MAVVPPLRGLLVSIVSCTLLTEPDLRFESMVEKWQLTAAGRDEHPKPMVSENPLSEVSVTETAAFCEAFMVRVFGVTVRLNPVAVVEMDTGPDEEGLWSASPS